MKFKSKSLISIILSIMMVISMILVAIPANSAVIDSEPVGADTYYLWYQDGKDNPAYYTKKLELKSIGDNLYEETAKITTSEYHYAIVNQNAETAEDNSIWTNNSQPTVTYDSSLEPKKNYIQSGAWGKYGALKFSIKNEYIPINLKFTFNSKTKAIHVSEASTTPQKYNITSAETSSGTFNVNKSTAAENETVTITASPNTNYEVDAVTVTKTDGTETVSVTGSGNSYTFTMPAYDVTVNVTFRASTVTSGDWYISGWIDKDKVDKPADKYKFTETTTSGVYSLKYTFKNDEAGYQYITINDGTNVYHPSNNNSVSGVAADGNKTNKDFNGDPKWMVKAAKDQSVEFTWNANTKTLSWKEATSKPVLATPSLSFPDGTVIAEASGSSVTLTVSNHSTISTKASDVTYHLYKDGNLYKTFTTNTYEITEAGSYTVKAVPGPSSSNTYNESAFSTAQTITKAGNLAYKYYLIGDNGNVSYEMTPSEANPKILYSSISFNKEYWFKIKRVSLTDSTDVKYSETTNNNFTLTPTASDTISSWGTNPATNNKNYIFNQSNVYYIKLDFTSSDTNPKISLSQTSDGKTSINVYTKDGTTVDGGTSPLGDTELTAINSDNNPVPLTTSDKYNVYTANSGDYLTIQTTMTATAAANGYYVYAFCINGISYPASAKANNVYETTYKVLGDEKNNLVEITPLYFNKNTEKNNDYITVYVDASELGDHWGNTISCYSYYYTGGSNKEAYSTTGYPGQPMILSSNGLYYTRVPRIAYADGQPRTKSDGKNYTISGITLNSFTENDLHGTLYPEIGKNYQTYDYDDFKYIADLGYDTVKFEIKYRTKTTNQSTLLQNDCHHKTGPSTISKETYAANNGWNDLLNFDGEHVDILGNKISNYDKDGSHLYVVSTGNQDVTNKGQWSTVWYVYDNAGNYITQGVPSDFIARPDGQEQTKAYKDIEDKNLTNVPVKITYESEMNADTSSAGKNGNSGVRIDGRWLYTKSTDQNVPVTVKVQYRDSDTDEWQLDANETAGTVKIDDVTSVEGVATKTFTERNVNAAISATSKSGYVFVEWGTVDEDGNNYTKLPVNSSSMDFLVDKSYTIVARFAKIQEGILSISHEKYTGDGALGGGGYYLVSAVIKNSNGTEIQSFPETEEAINIALTNEMLDGKYTIDITLKTIMKGENKFVDWFMLTPDEDYSNITQSADVWGSNDPVSQTITVDVADLYDENGANIVVSTLQYYSDIAPVTKDAILYYKYYNRFGEERTYTKVVELTEDYLQKHPDYYITDDLIYDNAPAVEDLHKNCTWTITDQKVTRQGTTATLWGTHSDLNHTVYFKTSENGSFAFKYVKDNDYLLDGSDEFFVANSKSAEGNKNFAYWIVYDYNEYINNNHNLKEIAKCYSTKFNLRILGDYYIYPVYDNVKSQSLTISDPTFTREQYTDSTGNIKSDYLYADFIVAYMSSNGILLNGDRAQTMKYHTGLIVEFSNNHKINKPDAVDAKLTADEFSALKEAYTADESFSDSDIQTFATSGSKSGSVKTDETKSKAMFKFDIKNEDYNNKNRLDYYVKFPNTAYYRHYVYKAYYYVYYTNDKGEVVYDMTEPVYFTLFDIGNSSAVTTKTTE